jgi:hypothetical protein
MADLTIHIPEPSKEQPTGMAKVDSTTVTSVPSEPPVGKDGPPSEVAKTAQVTATTSGPLGQLSDVTSPGLLLCETKPPKKQQTILYNQPDAIIYPAKLTDAQFNAISTSGLPVTYSIDVSAAALPPGIMIVAYCKGNDEWEDAPPKPVTVPVLKGQQTITYSQPAGLMYPAKLTDAHFKATSSSGLAVTYSIDKSASPRPPGIEIIARCNGNELWEDAPPKPVTVAVAKGKQTITFPSVPAITYPNKLTELHFKAKSSSGLDVTYSVDETTSPVPPNIVIVANCKGDDLWENAEPKSSTVVVRKGKQTVSFDPDVTTFPYGTKIGTVLNAKVVEEGGGEIFYEVAGKLLDLNSIPDCPKVAVTAKAKESDLYVAAAAKPVTFTVTPLEYEFDWAPVGTFTHRVKLGNIFDNGTITPNHEGAKLVFSVKPATQLAAGTHDITVSVSSTNKNYTSKPKTVKITVDKVAQDIVWTNIDDFPYGPATSAAKLKVAQNKTASGGALTYLVRKGADPAISYVPGMDLNAGKYTMIAVAAETSTHRRTEKASGEFKITKKPQSVEWNPLPKVFLNQAMTDEQKTAKVAGNPDADISYSPQGGAIPKHLGAKKFTVVVVAKEQTNFSASKSKTVQLDVVKAMRTIKWLRDFGTIKFGEKIEPVVDDVAVDPSVDGKKIKFSILNLRPGPNSIWATVSEDAQYDRASVPATVMVTDYPQKITFKNSTIRYKETLTSAQLNAVIEDGNTAAGLVYAVPEGSFPNNGPVAPVVGSPAFEIKATVASGNYFKEWKDVAARVTVIKAKAELAWTPPAAILQGTGAAFPNPSFVGDKGEVSADCWVVPNASTVGAGNLTLTAKSKASANYEEGTATAKVMVVATADTESISKGHAWGKHVLGNVPDGRADWNPQPASQADFDTIIQDVITRAAANNTCKVSNGKAYFWNNGRIVCYDPGSTDKGTCFKPGGPLATGNYRKDYYDSQ